MVMTNFMSKGKKKLGRPSKGDDARTKQVWARASVNEIKLIRAKYGTFRKLLDEVLYGVK